MTAPRWVPVVDPEPKSVALTSTGSAFHREGPKMGLTACGRDIAMWTTLDVITMDYCRRCWGPHAFRLREMPL